MHSFEPNTLFCGKERIYLCLFLNFCVWRCVQHKGWCYSLILRSFSARELFYAKFYSRLHKSTFKGNTFMSFFITQVRLFLNLDIFFAKNLCILKKSFRQKEKMQKDTNKINEEICTKEEIKANLQKTQGKMILPRTHSSRIDSAIQVAKYSVVGHEQKFLISSTPSSE